MKKLLTIILLMMVMASFAQSPESINYQAVARDASGNLYPNQSIRFQISILEGSPSGTVVYSEWHLTTTNAFGLANLAIGQGTVLSGTFNTIGWGTNAYYVKTEMDPAGGTSYQTMGTSQFLSVPYALYSKTSGSGGGGGGTVTTVNTSSPITGGPITTTGTIGITQANNTTDGFLSSSDWNIFNGKQNFITAGTNLQYFRGDKSWQTLNTTVVPEGANLYFTPARTRGTLLTGLSITDSPIIATDDVLTGFGKAQGQLNNRENPLTFTNGLTRITNTVELGGDLTVNTTITQDEAEALTFINSGTGKTTINLTSSGDFEILDNGSTFLTATDAGRVGIGTASPSQQLEITQSLALPNNTASAITGVIYKGTARFIHTYYPSGAFGYNTFVGVGAGNFSITNSSSDEGSFNTALGQLSLSHLTSGYRNTAMGSQAMYSLTSGAFNTALGESALYSVTAGGSNTAIGTYALMNNTTSNNIGIGASNLFNNTTGIFNVSIGNSAGYYNQTGSSNVIIGFNSGRGVSGNSFSNNSLFGYYSGYALTTGSNNILIGYKSGEAITTGGSNIVIGYDIDPPSLTGSNQLVIGASDLLFGNISTKQVGIGTTNPAQQLEITKSFRLPAINASVTTGVIYRGDDWFMHAYYPTGSWGHNTFVGQNAGNFSLTYTSLNDASSNTALGYNTLTSLTRGYFNTAVGASALSQATTGYGNVAVGSSALSSIVAGYQNIAIGDGALMDHTQYGNVAIGTYALAANTDGIQNISIGNYSANKNQTGDNNTIIGTNAGFGVSSNSFSNNSLFGYYSGYALTTGSNNILIGYKSGEAITTGGSNIVIGYDIDPPSLTGSNQLVIGASDLLFGNTSTKRIGIGTTIPGQKFVVGDGNIALSNTGTAGQMMFYEPSASGSNYSSFKAQAQIADVTYTLPVADGSSGQVLNTNGSGTLSWSSSESPLTFQNGITRTSNIIKLGGNLTESTTITQNAAEALTFTNSATANTIINLSSTGDFQIQDNGTAFLTATDGGLVGIGTTIPGQKLTVTDGNVALTNTGTAREVMFYEPSGNGTNYSSLKAQAQVVDVTYVLPVNDGTSGQVLSTNGSGALSWTTNNAITGSGAATRLAFWDGTTSLNSNANLNWDNSNSRLGIGTTAPTQQLELTGNLELPATTATTGIIYTGNDPFIHNYGTRNIFMGTYSGNFSLVGGLYNLGYGDSTLTSITSGDANVAIGQGALKSVTTSNGNVTIGYHSGKHISTNGYNTIIGYQSGISNTADRNTFLGCESGYMNTTGHYNVFLGHQAGYKNTTGDNCTAMGYKALYNQTADGGSTTLYNVAVGYEALYTNNPTSSYDGRENVAIGSRSLRSNTIGAYNCAVGHEALYTNFASNSNTAIGHSALKTNSSGFYNTSVGANSLINCASGASNTAIGKSAGNTLSSGAQNCLMGSNAGYDLTNGSYNVIIGTESGALMTTGTFNTVIGYMAKTTSASATNCLALGNHAECTADYQVMLGDEDITTLYCMGAYVGTVGTTRVDLYADNTGKIGYVSSSLKYKDNVSEMEDINWIYKLHPVNFTYKNDVQKKKQYGLIAEEVEQVNIDFVHYKDGQVETVQYSQLIAPMLKALQDQQKLIEQLKGRIEELERK